MSKYGYTTYVVLATAFLALLAYDSLAQSTGSAYRFDHGPYLQGLTEQSVYVYFTTSEKGFPSVELRETGHSEISRHMTIDGPRRNYDGKNFYKIVIRNT